MSFAAPEVLRRTNGGLPIQAVTRLRNSPIIDTARDDLLERVGEWNIGRIVGYPGDGINGLKEALDRAGHRI